MTDSFIETKRELYELMQRSRRERFTPPTPEGVTPSEARTMMAISGLGRTCEDIRPGRVAEMTHTTPSALSQTFKTLEEKGLIERHRSSDDYRAVSVSLTEEGERFAAEGKRLRDEHMDAVMKYVGVEDMQHLVRIMRKVVEFHDQDPEDACKSHAEGDDAPCA
ncbi:MarR family winged helix-turn-helix transcriptional regulator [Eggerthella guodeyinii]|uniref:MarR family transcriptional regulator n=1 Tax=Eggerthella guodeyinii TaxID=2690837 RepID=A0A6N7RR02_9ACTN|nr:MarR family winged helix-turn-helix transcriptional regulator [Eggerthella guodeyinii]MRX83689.1 MarR family transcriptional regulator [Eggerthella guodeyinii]